MVRNLVIVALLLLLMQACSAQKPYSFNLADFLSAKELPYDSPPQVIYRLDDHRFVTLERYRDCYHGETFYNDTKTGIRRKLGRGTVENFQGRIVNADLTGMNLVFPSAVAPYTVCGDRGCNPVMAYSTDGGNTFHGMVYARNIYKPFEDSKKYTVTATKDAMYVSEKPMKTSDYLIVTRYPLVPGFVYGAGAKLPSGWRIEYGVPLPENARTPSGQDRITCDASIKPTNPNAPLVR
ncbi:T6SS immunity protein Tli3 family protein [Burkholderia orbicola]